MRTAFASIGLVTLLSWPSAGQETNATEKAETGKVTAAGMSGFPINSQSEIASGNFANVIGVEITKVKESSASKIGGLFGKVTGAEDAAKAGTSSAEIVVTIYGKDGKTVVATSPARAEVKGKGSDAVKAAIDQVIGGLLSKVK